MHPLDPLSADEIRRVAAVLRRDRQVEPPRWRFGVVELAEPPKAALGAGEPPPREALVSCWNRDDGQTYKTRVSLDDDAVVTWEHRPGRQANFTEDEFYEMNQALAADPRVVEVLARYGVHDMSLVVFDTWAYGAHLVSKEHQGRRVGWTDVWVRESESANPYANPLSGLTFVVDANSLELLEIEETPTGERPPTMGEYVPSLVPGQQLRDDVKPLVVSQPEGVSFDLDGNLLTWQRWSMRLGFNPREGMVIHALGYADGDRLRPVAHRMSFAEMVVPYRDPTPDHMRRTAFDIGEWGLGFMTTSLELGCDCLGEISYLDAVLHDSKGEPRTIRNAICIHEEDDAVLWKHVDPVAGAEVRRSRRLVVSFHATVANYEYLVYWRFYQDGNIECEVRATGIMVTTSFPGGEQPPYGTLVDERTYAPMHQHFLVARLDLDVDGEANTVHMTESQALPTGPDNPDGLAIVQRSVPLRTEAEGKQDYDWSTQRAWKIVNDRVRNRLGTPVGYKLVPGGCFPAMHHVTRPEEWPVMPVDTVSFWLKPVGFFDRNPALDVPPA